MGSIATSLPPKLIERAIRAGLHKDQLQAEDGEHGKELARAEFAGLPSLKSQERFRCDSRLRGNILLLQPKIPPGGANSFS